jgi:hypothetical protein
LPRTTTQALTALILVLTLSSAMLAATPVIGVAISSGSFEINNSPVSGSATLFDGSTVRTASFASRLDLKEAQVGLGSNSRATVSQKRVLLEEGYGELGSGVGYQIEARSLRVAPQTSAAVARVQLEGATKIVVEALNGPVRVFNQAGLLVLNMKPGAIFTLEPQQGATNASDVRGCLLWKDGNYIVAAPDGQVVTLTGQQAALDAVSGNPVHVTGTAVAGPAGASQVIAVAKVDKTGEGGCVGAAQALGAQLTRTGEIVGPPPQTSAPVSHTALYAGIAIAAGGAIGIGVYFVTRPGKSQ